MVLLPQSGFVQQAIAQLCAFYSPFLRVDERYRDVLPTDCARVPVPKRVPGELRGFELRSKFAALPQVLQPLLTQPCVFPMPQYRTSLSAKIARSSPVGLPGFQRVTTLPDLVKSMSAKAILQQLPTCSSLMLRRKPGWNSGWRKRGRSFQNSQN